MASMNQQFKITKLAKDLSIKSRDLVDVLSQHGIEAKTTQKALEPEEFDVLFETLTRANQISNIGDYLDGKRPFLWHHYFELHYFKQFVKRLLSSRR